MRVRREPALLFQSPVEVTDHDGKSGMPRDECGRRRGDLLGVPAVGAYADELLALVPAETVLVDDQPVHQVGEGVGAIVGLVAVVEFAFLRGLADRKAQEWSAGAA
ncbi:hypothetical protein ACFZCU_30875 [Streptomyces canus]|uniref:hypothetical protein n=1 Tax=Streptomyces canus TaxID=58343 RepID=UPI0036EEF056